MNWLRRLLVCSFDILTRWLNKTEIIEEDIHISWADFLKVGKPRIILYTTKPCRVCEEIRFFLENNGIPHKKIKCKRIIPLRITSRRDLVKYMGFYGKDHKETKQLFLPPAFPQLDLIEFSGRWTRVVGNVNLMRNKVDEFIQKNIKDFPGFEMGIYGDKQPEQQAAEQVKRAMETNTKKGPFV